MSMMFSCFPGAFRFSLQPRKETVSTNGEALKMTYNSILLKYEEKFPNVKEYFLSIFVN